MRTLFVASLLLVTSAAAAAEAPRVITPGQPEPLDGWRAPNSRVTGAGIQVRQQQGVTILAPGRRQAAADAAMSAGRPAPELVYYADGSVGLRHAPTEAPGRAAPAQPFAMAYAPPALRRYVIDLPGYGPRMVIYR